MLKDHGLSVAITDGALEVAGTDDPALVSKLLADAGMHPSELTRVGADLESVYLKLTDQPDDETGQAS